jgi:hypothetical protein
MTPTRISNSATTTQCVEMLEKYPAIRESVRYACGHYRKIRLATRTTAFCHFLFTSKDPDEASKFFADLISGADLSGNDPVLVLRNRLFGTIKSKSKMTTMETMALTIKAWNYRRKGKTITAVRWRHEEGEDFPKAI